MAIYSIREIGLLLAQDPSGYSLILVMMAIGVLFYFLIVRPEQKRRREEEEEIKKLKINDRVVTVGGIIGTVVNIQKNPDEIVIRVDENNNTKMHFLRSAVRQILKDGKPAAKE